MKKFVASDLLGVLRAIVETNTKHHQEDFDMDIKTLTDAAKSAGDTTQEDRTFLWMVRTCGTWCARERNVFIRDSCEYDLWNYYKDQTRRRILAYRIEVIGIEDGKVVGTVHKLNYQKHCQYVSSKAIPASQRMLFYEKGERMQSARERVPIRKDPELGELVSFQLMPNDPQKLEALLREAGDSRNWEGRNRRK